MTVLSFMAIHPIVIELFQSRPTVQWIHSHASKAQMNFIFLFLPVFLLFFSEVFIFLHNNIFIKNPKVQQTDKHDGDPATGPSLWLREDEHISLPHCCL